MTVPPVVIYTLLAGAQIATVRSLVMILLFLTTVWLGRPKRVVLALACAAWLLVLPDPNALFDISFQLSFLSVLAIGLSCVGLMATTVRPHYCHGETARSDGSATT